MTYQACLNLNTCNINKFITAILHCKQGYLCDKCVYVCNPHMMTVLC